MDPHIRMWSGMRGLWIARHDFYMEQVKTRVLKNFDNMKEEADRVADEIYERLGSMYSEDGDLGAAAEYAIEGGAEFYTLLKDMKTQTTLGAMASLYHQWDKDFRDFLDDELSHWYDRDEISKFVWKSDLNRLFDTLEELGWPIRGTHWFQLLNAFRLIVNVYKHGKGPSFDELARRYPKYLKKPYDTKDGTSFLSAPRYADLALTEEEFDELAGAIRQFWTEFPERLSLPGELDTSHA